jgi:hypothetical protein
MSKHCALLIVIKEALFFAHISTKPFAPAQMVTAVAQLLNQSLLAPSD